MSKNLMDTEPGGEQTQYEAAHEDTKAHKKSAGQLGSQKDKTTTDPEKTEERKQARAEEAEKESSGQGKSSKGEVPKG